MQLNPAQSAGSLTIERYGEGGFRVGGVRYEGHHSLTADAVQPWNASDISALTADDANALLTHAPDAEIWVIGCGTTMQLLPADFKAPFRERRIAVEAMDTPAACRTYNILLSENRKVAAALMAV